MSCSFLTQGTMVALEDENSGALRYPRTRRNALADIFHDVDAGLVSELCQRCSNTLHFRDGVFASPKAEEASKYLPKAADHASRFSVKSKASSKSSSSKISSYRGCCKRRLSSANRGDSVVVKIGDDSTDHAHFAANRIEVGCPVGNASSERNEKSDGGKINDVTQTDRLPAVNLHNTTYNSRLHNKDTCISTSTTTTTQREKKNPLSRIGSSMCSDSTESFHAKECAKRSLVF